MIVRSFLNYNNKIFNTQKKESLLLELLQRTKYQQINYIWIIVFYPQVLVPVDKTILQVIKIANKELVLKM